MHLMTAMHGAAQEKGSLELGCALGAAFALALLFVCIIFAIDVGDNVMTRDTGTGDKHCRNIISVIGMFAVDFWDLFIVFTNNGNQLSGCY